MRKPQTDERPECNWGIISLMVDVPESERLDPSHDIAEAYAVETSDQIPGGCIIWGRYHGEWKPNACGRWLISRFLKSK